MSSTFLPVGTRTLNLRSNYVRGSVKPRPLTDVSKQQQPPRRHGTTLSADAAAADVMPSRGDEASRGGHHSQHSKRPVRTPESEHYDELPTHRRPRPLQPPAAPQGKLHQTVSKSASLEYSQEAWESAPGSPEMQDVRRRAHHARATNQLSGREMQYSDSAVHRASRHGSGRAAPGGRPGHPQLQPFWAALESGAQLGHAAEKGREWFLQEQQELCKACRDAVADQQHAEATRLLETQQLGMHIRDEKVAWQLLEAVSKAPQARLEDSLRLLGALRPFEGSLYALILIGLSEEKALRAQRVQKVFEAMRADQRIAPSAWDIGPWRQLLRLYGRLDAAEAAQQVFDHMLAKSLWHPADPLTVNILLNALSSKSEAAFTRFVELKELGCTPDLVTYNTMLKACMRSANLPCAEVIMTQLRQQGLHGSEVTYNTMIKVASYAGKVDRALAVLDDMAAAGFAPTTATWGSLLVACGKAGQVESAVALWKRMQQEGAAPSTDSCNALLTACLDCQHNERALTHFQEMHTLGVQPDTVTFNLALKACEAPANTTLGPGLLDTAFSLLRAMREQSVAPDAMTYTTLLGLCARAGNGRAALALHEEMKSSGFRVDTALLNALISALGSAGLAHDALAVFRTMVWGASRKRADQVTYRLMTRICREAGLIKEALHAYRGMRSCGFRPSNAEWQALIAAAVEAAMSGDGAVTAQDLAECLGLKKGEAAVDLHGLSGLEARAAVLCVLSSVQQRAAQGDPLEPHLTFITGVGRHSDPAQGPVLHDTVHKLLNEELKLATDDAGRPNPGCLVIKRQTLQQWLASRRHKAIGAQ